MAYGLNPTFWANAKTFIKDIRALDATGGSLAMMKIGERPVSRAEIVGHVVEKVTKHNRVIILVDDGSGTLSCTRFLDAKSNNVDLIESVQLGDLVRVHGHLSNYRLQMELKIVKLKVEKDPNVQSLGWLEALLRCTSIYKKPHKLNVDQSEMNIEA